MSPLCGARAVGRGFRWAVAVVAAFTLGAQLVPLGLPALAQLAHGLHHMTEDGGLDFLLDPHIHRRGPAHAASPVLGQETRASHRHARAVDLLLGADGGEERDDFTPPRPPVPTVDLHLPRVAAVPALPVGTPGAQHRSPANLGSQLMLPPELPPPRA